MDRCSTCQTINACPICGSASTSFDHVGVRGTIKHFRIPILDYKLAYDQQPSSIWHYSRPCGHRIHAAAATASIKYNGGPIWQDGYEWQNVYWGTYFATPAAAAWIRRLEQATVHLEADASYSGGLRQYNAGIGKVINPVTVNQDPPAQLSNELIQKVLTDLIASRTIADLGTKGAYNIFLPPGTTTSLSPSDLSCQTFCDFHDSVNGTNGPFYTVEPYPCPQGCNQCTTDPFDTITQGLSEEMVELKTDMDPGSGWVIGNEELCDFCDATFVCKRISTGEYVNAWYDKSISACWKP